MWLTRIRSWRVRVRKIQKDFFSAVDHSRSRHNVLVYSLSFLGVCCVSVYLVQLERRQRTWRSIKSRDSRAHQMHDEKAFVFSCE